MRFPSTGTTTLKQLLQKHPDIAKTGKKELRFFDSGRLNSRRNEKYEPTLEKFYKIMKDANVTITNGYSEKMIGDVTPLYMIMSDMIPTIKRLCP